MSLLCSDYKLLSEVLASRLSRVMEQVIQYDQTYCVPHTLICDNIIKLFGLVSVGIISIDQEKAFGHVEHEHIWLI